MFFSFCSPLTIRHSLSFFKATVDQMIQRMLEEGLDEFVFGVVGAGGGAFVALGKGEVPFAVDLGDAGFEFE